MERFPGTPFQCAALTLRDSRGVVARENATAGRPGKVARPSDRPRCRSTPRQFHLRGGEELNGEILSRRAVLHGEKPGTRLLRSGAAAEVVLVQRLDEAGGAGAVALVVLVRSQDAREDVIGRRA